MKFFAAGEGGLAARHVDELILLAQEEAGKWCDAGTLPADDDEGCAQTVRGPDKFQYFFMCHGRLLRRRGLACVH